MTRREIRSLISRNKDVRFDLGCGNNKQQGFIGIDTRKLRSVDIVCNLEDFPWPIPSNCARAIIMSHFWEHISPKNTIGFMDQLHRICKNKAQIFISGPYGTEFRFIQDPTHCNPSNEATFLYWDPRHELYKVYEPKPFHLISFELFPVGHSRDFNAILEVIK